MKLLEEEINLGASSGDCAREVLDVIPQIMRAIRADLRRGRDADLSVAQFRTLVYLGRQSGASLSELAEHIGLTLPSMSKLVDGLVDRGLANRAEDPKDRRRLMLCLTGQGQALVEASLHGTQSYLAGILDKLSREQRATIVAAMDALRQVFDASV